MKRGRTINLVVDEALVSVPEGSTIMEAAETIGIRIPRLCYHPKLSLAGSCRVCIVDVEGMAYYMAACSSAVWEGMRVRTHSPGIRNARRDIIELLLDNHPRDCQTCERDGHCELQNLAYAFGVRERLFEGRRKRFPIDDTSHAVVRDSEKCVLCGRCVRVCAEVQGVYNLDQQGRGFETVVAPAGLAGMDESACVQCGQCIAVCPVAAFIEPKHTEQVFEAIADPKKKVVVQTAPSIRSALGEEFGMKPGTPVTGKMITALRRLGFDVVFDTDLGADLTIVEESSELVRRLKGEGPLPMFTSCSPGWISFLEKFYPELIPHASTCRSPMTMLSALTKTYWAQRVGLDPQEIYMVAVMPCVAKKFECRRPEHYFAEGLPFTDAVITTRELAWMLESTGIDFGGLPDGEFDAPLGISSGAGDIFGITGGVMEATLRTAAARLDGKLAGRLELTEVRNAKGIKEAEVELADRTLRVAVANGLANAKRLLDAVSSKEKEVDVVEVMACPGGCSGGGGQPYPAPGTYVLDPGVARARGKALYRIDSKKALRSSHENPAIREIYETFLGDIGGSKARDLLHTSYAARLPRGVR